MLPQLDRWVVRKVAERLARGSTVPHLAVNVSGQTLDDAEFPEFFEAQRKSAGLPIGAMLFEIDESDALAQPESAARFAGAIKAAGGGLLIDGFGRRAVSFTVLKTMRVDYIKVDGAITRKLLTSEAAVSKMKAIVRVAEAIGAGVVAEFVEEPDVLVRLRALGVGYAQGFGVHQPQPMEAVLG
jgi:EAL domain-containing protein (putative c-di-GMP-specific phosphodiesterase class I)